VRELTDRLVITLSRALLVQMVPQNTITALDSECGYVGGEMLTDGVWESTL
jgi:hypothetical protein